MMGKRVQKNLKSRKSLERSGIPMFSERLDKIIEKLDEILKKLK